VKFQTSKIHTPVEKSPLKALNKFLVGYGRGVHGYDRIQYFLNGEKDIALFSIYMFYHTLKHNLNIYLTRKKQVIALSITFWLSN
jgi:hypothetical protein